MLTWTDEMGYLAADPAHEDAVRKAVIAACEHYAALDPKAEQPKWNVAQVGALPQNAAARTLLAVIEKALGTAASDSNLIRQRLIGTAVQAAQYYASLGKNDAAWKGVAQLTRKKRSANA